MSLSASGSGVDYVKFYVKNTSTGTSENPGGKLTDNGYYTTSWSTSGKAAGSYLVRVVGYSSSNGQELTDDQVYIDLESVSEPASIELDEPSDGDTFEVGETVSLSASGSGVDYVKFYVKNTSTQTSDNPGGRLTGSGYNSTSWSTSGKAAGSYLVRAVGYNSSGQEVTDDQVYIDLESVSEPTFIELDEPSDGNSYNVGETITLTADASGVEYVKYYVKNTSTGKYENPGGIIKGNETYTTCWLSEDWPSGKYLVRVVGYSGSGAELTDDMAYITLNAQAKLPDHQQIEETGDGMIKVTQQYEENKPASNSITVVQKSNITVKIDGKEQTFSQPPVMFNDSVLVPLRGIFEALGAKVNWDSTTKTITAIKGKTNIILKIGDKFAIKNGVTVQLDSAAQIIHGSTMVPVRFISESLGASVDWNSLTQTVSITQMITYNYSNNETILEDIHAVPDAAITQFPIDYQGINFQSNSGTSIGSASPSSTIPSYTGYITIPPAKNAKAEQVPIYVPPYVNSTNANLNDGWITIRNEEKIIKNFNPINMFIDFNLGTIPDEAFKSGGAKGPVNAAKINAAVGIINVINKGVEPYTVNIIIQEKNGKRRAILQLGDIAGTTTLRNRAGETWYPLAGPGSTERKKYINDVLKITDGSDPKFDFDIVISIDSKHKNDTYIGYLCVNDKKEIVLYPKLYPKDKLELRHYEWVTSSYSGALPKRQQTRSTEIKLNTFEPSHFTDTFKNLILEKINPYYFNYISSNH